MGRKRNKYGFERAIQIETCKDYEKDLQDEYYQLSMRYKRLKATLTDGISEA